MLSPFALLALLAFAQEPIPPVPAVPPLPAIRPVPAQAPPAKSGTPAPRHEVLLGTQPFATWRLDGRVPAVWPLLAPGGVPITRDFPFANQQGEAQDHPHHLSLWTAHGKVNGVDFWHDPASSIVPRGPATRSDEEGRTTLSAQLAWNGPKGQTQLVETRRLQFHGEDGLRWVDRQHRFTAPSAGPAIFGDTKEGAFAIRLRRELCPDHGAATLRNSEGQSGKAVWGQPARWIRYEGLVDGAALGVALFDHPANPRHPTRWHARTYGLAAANPFGLHHFSPATAPAKDAGSLTLKAGETLSFQHAILLYAGSKSPAELNALWKAWSEQP